VPTRCRHRGGIVDSLGCKACRAIRQPNQPIQSDTGSLDPKSSKTRQFSVIRRFIGIESHASESYYHSYTVATSGVNGLDSQICHNGLFRKKLQHSILPMISTEVSSLAAHNRWTLASLDIKAAYLQAEDYNCLVFVKLLCETRTRVPYIANTTLGL
jgi:hypothetical protein